MVKQFSGEEVIFLCQYLPNNKSITIMIHHCNFFINKYGRLLPSNVSWRGSPYWSLWPALIGRGPEVGANEILPPWSGAGVERGEERQLKSGWWCSSPAPDMISVVM